MDKSEPEPLKQITLVHTITDQLLLISDEHPFTDSFETLEISKLALVVQGQSDIPISSLIVDTDFLEKVHHFYVSVPADSTHPVPSELMVLRTEGLRSICDIVCDTNTNRFIDWLVKDSKIKYFIHTFQESSIPHVYTNFDNFKTPLPLGDLLDKQRFHVSPRFSDYLHYIWKSSPTNVAFWDFKQNKVVSLAPVPKELIVQRTIEPIESAAPTNYFTNLVYYCPTQKRTFPMRDINSFKTNLNSRMLSFFDSNDEPQFQFALDTTKQEHLDWFFKVLIFGIKLQLRLGLFLKFSSERQNHSIWSKNPYPMKTYHSILDSHTSIVLTEHNGSKCKLRFHFVSALANQRRSTISMRYNKDVAEWNYCSFVNFKITDILETGVFVRVFSYLEPNKPKKILLDKTTVKQYSYNIQESPDNSSELIHLYTHRGRDFVGYVVFNLTFHQMLNELGVCMAPNEMVSISPDLKLVNYVLGSLNFESKITSTSFDSSSGHLILKLENKDRLIVPSSFELPKVTIDPVRVLYCPDHHNSPCHPNCHLYELSITFAEAHKQGINKFTIKRQPASKEFFISAFRYYTRHVVLPGLIKVKLYSYYGSSGSYIEEFSFVFYETEYDNDPDNKNNKMFFQECIEPKIQLAVLIEDLPVISSKAPLRIKFLGKEFTLSEFVAYNGNKAFVVYTYTPTDSTLNTLNVKRHDLTKLKIMYELTLPTILNLEQNELRPLNEIYTLDSLLYFSVSNEELEEYREIGYHGDYDFKEPLPLAKSEQFHDSQETLTLSNSQIHTKLEAFKNVPINNLLITPLQGNPHFKLIDTVSKASCVIYKEASIRINQKIKRSESYESVLSILRLAGPVSFVRIGVNGSSISVMAKNGVSISFLENEIPYSHLKYYFPDVPIY